MGECGCCGDRTNIKCVDCENYICEGCNEGQKICFDCREPVLDEHILFCIKENKKKIKRKVWFCSCKQVNSLGEIVKMDCETTERKKPTRCIYLLTTKTNWKLPKTRTKKNKGDRE